MTVNPSAPKLNIGLYVKPGSTIIAPCYAGIIIIITIMIITIIIIVEIIISSCLCVGFTEYKNLIIF